MSDSSIASAHQSPFASSNGRLMTFAILAMIGIGALAWDFPSADRNSLSLIRLLPGVQFVILAGLALVRKVPLRATIGAYTGGLLVIATVYYAIWYDSLNYNGGGANIGLGIMALAAVLLLPIPMLIGGLIAVWLRRHRPYDLLRGLSVCALCAGCFAIGFVRVGWDKAAVAFLFIFVPTATIAIGRWSVLRQYQSTFPPKDPTDKVQP